MDLAAWLSSLGLGQYSGVFAENDIDFDVLGQLDEADFERLGLSFGHRRKLIGAIAQRRADSSGEHQAERRQVTVVFCDLVNSTPLANLLDPEDMASVIRQFKHACTQTITGHDGFVAQFMGDGALAYFGYPRAKEDAAEQAVRAALALVERISRMPRPDGGTLQGRAGVATGTVMIGEVIGDGSAREVTVVGDTVHLAARLQGLAQPGSVVIANGTYELLGKRFEYEGLGEQVLKGFTEPVTVWRVAGETISDSRFAATRAKSSGFVGRESELSTLVEKWRHACEGRGNAVVVDGDPGLGKSRLVEALLDNSGEAARLVVKCQCSPYHANSALHPVIRNIERAVGFEANEGDESRLDKLDRYLASAAPALELAPALFADLLGLPTARYPAADFTPMQRKAKTLEALTEVILALAQSTPVLLLLEDAHWADPTTLELWSRKIDRIGNARVLLLVTARPEFACPWLGRRNVASIHLAALGRDECAKLAAQAAAPVVLPQEVVGDIVAKSDGIPLYVEELTKATRAAIQGAVPATLHDSLMASLDRVGAAKSLAQTAAVIGQQFTRSLLAAVTELPPSRLDAELQRLSDAALIVRMNRTPEPAFAFRHALLRDIAYENLLRPKRQQMHERVARTIAEGFPAISEQEPEVLAHHYAQAGRFDLAATWLERAGDRATSRSSFVEAVAHFEAALANMAQLEKGEVRTRREMELLLKLGTPLTLLRGPQHPSVREAYDRAYESATEAGDEEGSFKATWGRWYHSMVSRQLERAKQHSDELVRVAEAMANEDLLLEGLHCRWSTAHFRGDIDVSAAASAEGMRRYDPERHAWMGLVFGGHDPGVCAYSVQSMALALRGRDREARECGSRAVALAEELSHPTSISHALLNMTMMHQVLGDDSALESSAGRLLELAERYNFPPQLAHAKFMNSWLRARRGELEAPSMVEEFSKAMAMGPFYRYYAALLAELCVQSGHHEKALETLGPALESVTEPGVGLFVSELHRLHAHCLKCRGSDLVSARRAMETAIDVARRQGVSVFERRAKEELEGFPAA